MQLLWLGFLGMMVLLIALDLFVLRPRGSRAGRGESVAYGAYYLLLAMVFNVVVFVVYKHRFLSAGEQDDYTVNLSGGEASLQYLACFLLEFVLGLDSAFVVGAVFSHFKVSETQRHRVLMWGMLLGLVVRAGLVLVMGAGIHSWTWFRFILALLLAIAAVRMILVRKENLDPQRNIIIRMLRRVAPIATRDDDGSLVVTEGGRRALGRLIVPLLLIETGLAYVAFDSIPASYAVTREPFLIFAAGAFAMLCVRSLSPALLSIINRVRYFKIGLAMILVYCSLIIAVDTPAFREFLDRFELRPVALSTLGKLSVLGGGVLVGLLAAFTLATPRKPGEAVSDMSPLGPEADRLAREALSTTRKVAVGAIGITGLALGAVMAIGPGPGIPVVLGSLLLLATEFAIAKRFVDKYRPKAEEATRRAVQAARAKFNPWALVFLIMLTVGASVALVAWAGLPVGLVIGAALPMVLGQILLGYLAYFHKDSASPRDAESSRNLDDISGSGK